MHETLTERLLRKHCHASPSLVSVSHALLHNEQANAPGALLEWLSPDTRRSSRMTDLSQTHNGKAGQRKIIHVDCDCFYAAVEMLDDPRLRRVPLAVGGDHQGRGVIATCNYEARASGVRSAMPSAHARRLCPQLVIVPPRFDRYREIAKKIFAIYQRYANEIETLSLDEAFLDVTDSEHCRGSATWIAQTIKKAIREEVGITVSAGVAPNKFLAKVASEWKKPDGLYVIEPDAVDAFVRALPVESMFGVGPATASRMHALDVHTCEDLRRFSRLELAQQFGQFGERLYQLCRGIDDREVKSNRPRKSLSVENTYEYDLPDLETCLSEAQQLITALHIRLAKLQRHYRIIKLFVKVRFNDFTTTSMECVSLEPDTKLFLSLLKAAWARESRPVRLLGVGVRFREITNQQSFEQLNLPFPDPIFRDEE